MDLAVRIRGGGHTNHGLDGSAIRA